ncbi:unnamed protein product, partial [Phaeothamnion confervicola]
MLPGQNLHRQMPHVSDLRYSAVQLRFRNAETQASFDQHAVMARIATCRILTTVAMPSILAAIGTGFREGDMFKVITGCANVALVLG